MGLEGNVILRLTRRQRLLGSSNPRMTKAPFPTLDVRAAGERDEPIGSKAKFWFRDPTDHSRWLFKYARDGTGEHWAEKIAAELAELIGLPHAIVELARLDSEPGIATRDFTSDQRRKHLVHGNELLFRLDATYPKERGYHVREHTLDAVRRAIKQSQAVLPSWPWPVGVVTAWEGFVGYLLLDAWIGNTDRHHQNWGVLVEASGYATLAPTFDHASSLGREIDDAERMRRLATADARGDMRAYAGKARSALYDVGGCGPLHPCEAFVRAVRTSPIAGDAWISRLCRVDLDAVLDIVARVPERTMSVSARQFALALLQENRQRLVRSHVR